MELECGEDWLKNNFDSAECATVTTTFVLFYIRTLHPVRLSRQAPVLAIVGWKEKIFKGPQKNDLISSD